MTKFKMDFGELNQFVSIYNIVISRDDIGGEIASKLLLKQVWAKISSQTEQQKYSQSLSSDLQLFIIYTRFDVEISKQMLIEHDGDFYEIQSVVNVDSADKWLKIVAMKSEDV